MGGHLYRGVNQILADMPATILVHASGRARLFVQALAEAAHGHGASLSRRR